MSFTSDFDLKMEHDNSKATLFDNDQQNRCREEFFNELNFWKPNELPPNDFFTMEDFMNASDIDNGLNSSAIFPDVTSIPAEGHDDFILNEDFKPIGNFPLDEVLNNLDFDVGSDSGLSTDNCTNTDFMSPSSGTSSPDPRVDISVDTTDAVSDVSSTSDLGSLGSVGSSPSGRSDSNYSTYTPIRFDLGTANQRQFDDDIEMKCLSVPLSEHNPVIINSPKRFITSPQFITKLSTSTTNTTPTRSFKVELNQHPKLVKQINTSTVSSNNFLSSNITTINSVSNITSNTSSTRTPIIAKVRLDTGKLDSNKNGNIKPTSPQTIVMTQSGKGNSFRSNTTFLKASSTSGGKIFLPVNVNVNDFNQMQRMKSIKIISSTGNNLPGIRRLVSAVRPVSSSTNGTTGNRTTLYTTSSKGSDGCTLIKVTPTALVTPNSRTDSPNMSVITPSYTVKEEQSDEEEEIEIPQDNQEIVLTEEEKRLMRKEGLTYPTKYPLTKQEERDLKRIRRKIRNKISAQDSRKRKKEYVDGLEDRVKNCTEENQQLQKRIKTLERQNESLIAQLRKFQNLVGGLHTKHHTHASTALMMLILSTALFVVPSLRSQDGKGENELAGDNKMPSTGHTRSLLEVKNAALNMKNLEGYSSTDEDDIDPLDYTNALSDHDYAPFATKKARLENLTPTYYSAPSVDKTLPRENGDPPDSGGLNGLAAMIGAMLDRLGNNWTDPGGSFGNSLNQTPPHAAPERSVVVNLNHGKRLRDDIELE